jgi:hypothetical protein
MTDKDKRFNTHIKEPRWQQAASVIAVLGVIAVWLWLILH